MESKIRKIVSLQNTFWLGIGYIGYCNKIDTSCIYFPEATCKDMIDAKLDKMKSITSTMTELQCCSAAVAAVDKNTAAAAPLWGRSGHHPAVGGWWY